MSDVECQVCFNSLLEEADDPNRDEPPAKKPKKMVNLNVTDCGHIFHRICIRGWTNGNGESDCPSCRQEPKPLKPVWLPPPMTRDPNARRKREEELMKQVEELLEQFAKLRLEKDEEKEALTKSLNEEKKKLEDLTSEYQQQQTRLQEFADRNRSLSQENERLKKEIEDMKTRAICRIM